VELSYIFGCELGLEFSINDLGLLVCPEGSQKVKKVFAFLAQSRAVTACEQRKPGRRWGSALTGKIPVGRVRPEA
jgi:hypothetical protein